MLTMTSVFERRARRSRATDGNHYTLLELGVLMLLAFVGASRCGPWFDAERRRPGYDEAVVVDSFAVSLYAEQLVQRVDHCVPDPAGVDGHGDPTEPAYLVLCPCDAERPIVISAGRDRLFGTSDDVISGERNDPDARVRHAAWWPRSYGQNP